MSTTPHAPPYALPEEAWEGDPEDIQYKANALAELSKGSFTPEQAKVALVKFDGNYEEAMNWLIENNPNETLLGIAKKYGIYPLMGLSAAIIFGKEIVVLNDELLFIANLALVLNLMKFYLGDTIKGLLRTQKQAEIDEWKNVAALGVEVNQIALRELEAQRLLPAVIKNYAEQAREVAKMTVESSKWRTRQAYREEFVKKLDAIVLQEAGAKAQIRKEMLDKAFAYIQSQLAADNPALKQALVNFAIENIGATKAQGKDPVRQLFIEYFNNLYKGKKA